MAKPKTASATGALPVVASSAASMADAEGSRQLVLEALIAGECWEHCRQRLAVMVDKALLEALYEGSLRLARTNLASAIRMGQATLAVAAELGDAASLGVAARANANLLYLQGQHAAALAAYQQAIAYFQQAGDTMAMRMEVARTRNSAIQTLAYLARYAQAIAWAEEARVVFAELADEARLARLDGNLGNLYFRLDRFEEAMQAYGRALTAFRRAGSPQDIAAALSNVATCCISVGEFQQALEVHQEARAHCAAHGFSLLVAQADYNIAYLHLHRGDLHEAMRLYAMARAHCAKVGDAYHAALCDLDQAELMLEVNLLSEAERLAQRAARGFRTLNMQYEHAKATVFLAIALARAQQLEQARKRFLRARRLFAAEDNAVWIAYIDLHLALLGLARGDLRRALIRAQRALLVLEEQQVPGKWILAQLALARIHQAMGNFQLATAACRLGLRKAETIGSPSLRFACLAQLGDALLQQAQPQSAQEALQRAADELDRLRTGVPGEDLRISYFHDKAQVFEKLALLHLDAERTLMPVDGEAAASGWACLQRAKSRALLDSLEEAPAARSHAVADRQDEGSDEATDGLRRLLHQTYVSASDAELRGQTAEAAKWHDRACKLERQLQEHRAQRRLLGHALDRGRWDGATAVASLEQLQQVLRPGELFVEYFCAGERMLAFAVAAGSRPVCVALGDPAPVKSTARLALFQISSHRYRAVQQADSRQGWPALASHLQRLYDALLAPVLAAAPPTTHTLIVAPHGFLHSIPFAALGSVEAPLGGAFRILRTPSATAYALATVAGPKQKAEALGHHPRALLLAVPDQRAPLIQSEVESIHAMISGARLYIGRKATLDALREEGAHADLIHIASHGAFRTDNPMFSSIRLGNGNLNLYELQQLRLPTRLVTLSGCSTGVHAVLGGDELMGLSRGFFQAGARQVMVTLWEVNDGSTATFMNHFYRGYLHHGDSALASREAAMQVRQLHPHPYHWAPFSLMVNGAAELAVG